MVPPAIGATVTLELCEGFDGADDGDVVVFCVAGGVVGEFGDVTAVGFTNNANIDGVSHVGVYGLQEK